VGRIKHPDPHGPLFGEIAVIATATTPCASCGLDRAAKLTGKHQFAWVNAATGVVGGYSASLPVIFSYVNLHSAQTGIDRMEQRIAVLASNALASSGRVGLGSWLLSPVPTKHRQGAINVLPRNSDFSERAGQSNYLGVAMIAAQQCRPARVRSISGVC
jgi:hypothetical protein